MKNIRKILLGIIMLVLFVQNAFSGIVLAQSSSTEFLLVSEDMGDEDDGKCRTCTMPSLEFQTYVNFQVDMMQVLRKAVRIKDEGKDNKTVGMFSAGILKLPTNLIKSWVSMFKKGSEELTEGYRTLKMGVIMLGSITTEIISKDGVGGLKILFRNESFVREWTTLQDLDMSIHDAMRDLGMEGIWDDTISSDISEEIGKLKSKYIKNTGNELGLFEQFDMKGDVKYKDIINLMLKLNGVMKTFISTHSKVATSDFFKSFLWKIDDEISKGNIVTRFNMDLMEKMFASYKCAEGISACSSMWKDFANNTKVWAQIKKGLTDSGEIIKKANEDFSKAMLSVKSSVKDTVDKDAAEEAGLTPKQLTLLRTVYGIDTTKLSKEQGIGLESLLNGSAGKNIANSIDLKSLDYFSTESRELKEEAKRMADKEKADARYLESLSASEAKKAEDELLLSLKKIKEEETYDSERLRAKMLNTLDVVFVQKQEDKKVFMIYSNLAITRYFVEIGALIHDIMEDPIGTKDSKGLIKYLGEACETQCSNKGTINCYAR